MSPRDSPASRHSGGGVRRRNLACTSGLDRLPSFGDIKLSIVRNRRRSTGRDALDEAASEVAVRLPVFDWGELRRQV